MGAPIVAIGVAIGEMLETVGGRVVFGVLLDIVEALALGNPILAEILLGLPEHFLVALISGKLGLLDSQFLGVGLGFVLRGWAKKNEEQSESDAQGMYAMERWLAIHISPLDRVYSGSTMTPNHDIELGISLGALGLAKIPSSVFEAAKGAIADLLVEAPEVVL